MASRIDRRFVLAGLAASPIASGALAAPAAGPYLDYERKLREALAQPGGEALTGVAADLLAQTNALRVENKLAPLEVDPAVELAARAHVADMVRRSFFSHDDPGGLKRNDRIGLLLRQIVGVNGENIAMIQRGDGRPQATAADIIDVWRNSKIHRENLLLKAWTHVGFASIRADARVYACAVFVQVQQRLAAPLPLQATDPGSALAGAKPAAAGYQLSGPTGAAEKTRYNLTGPAPKLAPGVWRLRPFVGKGSALLGPIFIA